MCLGVEFLIFKRIQTINDAKRYLDRYGWNIFYGVHAVMQAIVKHHNSGVKELLDKYNVPPVSEGRYYMGETTTAATVDSVTLAQLEDKNNFYRSDDTSTRYDIDEINKFFGEILKDVKPAAEADFWKKEK